MQNDEKVKLQMDVLKVCRAYVGLVQKFPESFVRDQALARFQESIMWTDKCFNDPQEPEKA